MTDDSIADKPGEVSISFCICVELAKFEFVVQITTSTKPHGADLQSHARLNTQCTLLIVH